MNDFAGPPKTDPEPEPEPDPPPIEPDSPPIEPPDYGAAAVVTDLAAPAPSVASTRKLLGASFDLLTRASDDMRRASFYIGFIVLGTVAPLALAAFGIQVVSIHTTEREMDGLLDAGLDAWSGLLVMLMIAGVWVAYFESRIMAATILGGHWVGRPVSVRQSLARSRMVFWYAVIAWVIVLIPVLIAQTVLSATFSALVGEQTDLSVVSSVLVSGLVGAPFVYLLTGVVLGDVDPAEATRRSFRVFRARRLAAALAAIFETVAIVLVILGLSAGLDIALRAFDALGLGVDSGPAGLILIALGLIVGVFALGTLIFTAFAISVAPQVVMFVGLTHATFGLDHVRSGGDRDPDRPIAGARPFHWLTWPMRIAIGLGIIGLLSTLAVLRG